ncbi:MAG: hypothetical protein ACR2PL_04315 [Dehalococcoidia bacterium]
MKYYAVHLTAAELAIIEEATTAALEQLGRTSISDPHGYADAAITEDLMDALLDQVYDAADEAGAEDRQTVLVVTEDLRDVARALLTAASSALGDRSLASQEDGRIAEAALLLTQATLARHVELRLSLAALSREE